MRVKLFVMAGICLAAGSVWAQSTDIIVADKPMPPADMLIPRAAVPKPVIVQRPRDVEAKLIVKFRDHVQARPQGGAVSSLSAAPIDAVNELLTQFGLSVAPAFEQSFEELEMVQRRAAIFSGKAQPDLAGIMVVQGNDAQLEEAANALNALDQVEYVEFLQKPVEHFAPAPMLREMVREVSAAVRGGTPNFVPLQRHHNLAVDVNGNGFIEDFGGDGIPGTSDDEFYGGFDLGLAYEIGELLARDLRWPTWNPDKNGARGATVRVGVVEGNADVGRRRDAHEDLRHVILEPGQTLLPHVISERNHGSATLGIIAARDHGLPGPDRFVEGDNAELGTIGMAPDVQAWFFPTASVEQPGGRLLSAILSAHQRFEHGDVLSFSIGQAIGPLVISPTMGILMGQGSDLGITSVMSAGNECFNLDELEYPAGDGGAIIVGAGAPFHLARIDLYPWTRYGFSNHHETINADTATNRVMCQAWGGDVVTCGYGDLQFDPDRRLRYTFSFGGTSAAAPMIAATAASLQGMAKTFFGIPLMPTQIREVITGSYFCQEGICNPFEHLISGTFLPEDDPPGDPCNILDLIQGPDEPPPDIIGGIPAWHIMLGSLLTSAWFDPSFVEDLIIYNGVHLYGNVNSLKEADNNPLILASKFHSGGPGSGGGQFPPALFMFPGEFTDIGVLARALDPQRATGGSFGFIVSTTDEFPMFGCQVYNWDTGLWDWAGQMQMVPGPYQLVGPFQFNRSHIRQDGAIIVRGWVLALGFGGRFHTSYDEVLMTIIQVGGSGGIGG